jgi:acyl-coenzyme A synthetase/AMP-(fatty) acid ligase
VAIDPQAGFNIIYSSGTTGEPKGIVQSQAMRWAYAARAVRYGYGSDTVTLVSTPLYSTRRSSCSFRRSPSAARSC